MKAPQIKHSGLWNDMPIEERARLMPHVLESQLLHIWQCKQTAITAHNRHMKEIDGWIASIERELVKYN